MLVLYIDKYAIKKANKNKILIDGDKQIINPKDEDFIRLGYKQLVETEQPSYDEETQYLSLYYEIENNEIYQRWEIYDRESEVL